MRITITATTLALGVAGVFSMTGTASAQGEYGYICDTVMHVDSGTMGVGNCVPELGTPAVDSINAPFTLVTRDNGVRYPCGPAVATDRSPVLSAVTVAPAGTAGLICVPPLPRYLPALS